MRSRISRFTSLISTTSLLLGLLVAVPLTFSWPTAANAANPTCASGMAPQASLSAVPAHGKVFYIDSGITPKVDAAYIGYKIQNSSSSTISGLWVSVGDFVGGKVSLANPLDQYQQMDPIPAGEYKTAYFLIKASGSTTASQSHTVKVFPKRPDISGATPSMTCDFIFSQIQETIKASANKIETTTGTLSPATATLGGKLTVEVTGATGKVGSGKSPDFSIIWVSPAAVSSWPTRALRLESTTLTLYCSGSDPDIVLIDTLIQSTAASSCYGSAGTWKGSYIFRIIGPGPSNLSPSPIANIASGTQYKHSDTSGLTFATPINLSGVATSSFRVKVDADSVLVTSSATAAQVRYTITLTTTSTTAVEVDEIVDRAAAGTTYVTGSSTLNGSSTSDPSYLASESTISPPPIHYIGPFSVVSGSPVVITFIREIPCSVSTTSYSNTSFAKTGDQVLGESATTIPGVTVATTSGTGPCSAVVTDNPQTIAPTTQTLSATSITTTTATLNGFSNAYNGTAVTSYFRYSRDKNVATSVTSTTPQSVTGTSTTSVAQALTGLSTSTTYYFQIVITSPTTPTTYGAILSFVTDAVQAVPNVLTSAATSVQSSSATLNGSLNPNLTPLTGVQFIYGKISTLPPDVIVDATGANGALTISVASATGISVGMTATGTRIGTNAVVSAISGTTITLSVANTNTVNTSVTFSGTTNSALQMDDGNGTLVAMTLSGSGVTDVSLGLTGLVSGTKYYFKLRGTCAVNATYCPSGFVDGAILNFTTGAPNVATQAATLVADVTATINGNVQQASNTDTWEFIYCSYNATTCNLSGITSGTRTAAVSQGNTTLANVSANLVGLTAGTVYYFQILGYTSASASFPVSTGAVLSFETLLITTSTLDSGAQGSIYSSSVAGSGGSGSYTWSVTSGMPTGLTISSTGLVSGTPTTAGTYSSVVVKMYDPYYETFTEKTLTIVISAPVFTVTFYSNFGANLTSTQASGVTANLTANSFARSGYTFAGWNTVATPSSGTPGTGYVDAASYSFSADLTLYAQWTVNPYVITFNANTGTYIADANPKTASLNYNSDALTQVPETPSKTGYTLLGWNTSSTATVALTTYLVPASTGILFAVWSKNSYVVSFNAVRNGGAFATGTVDTQTVSVAFELNAISYAPSSPSKTGETFIGWNTDPAATSQISSVIVGTSPITLYAIYVAGTVYFTINFDRNGATGDPSSLSETQSASTLALNLATVGAMVKPNYTFIGWNLTGVGTKLSGTTYTPSSNITLNAIWELNTYTITYVAGSSGTLSGSASQSVSHGSDGGAVTVTANAGYTFTKWDEDNSTSSTRTEINVTSNKTFTAIYSVIGYTITYATTSSDGGTAPANTTGTGLVTLRTNSGNLIRSGYSFGGWNTGTNCSGTNYLAGASFTLGANITLYPCWNLISSPTPVVTPQPAPKEKPAITWKNPNAIKTTTTLSTTQLNAVATTTSATTAPTIVGTYVYTPIIPTVVTSGTKEVTNITSANNAISGTIKAVTPTTTTPTGSDVPVLGQGTTLAPGLQKMKVVFIPTDTTKYEPVETIVEILVQAETKVNWVEPAPIKKTTPVSTSQLNAVGIAPGLSNNVPGTYKYDIPEGTTLAPGKYPVKVIFTPTDPNYLPSESTVTITVIADINPLATPIVTPSNTPAGKPITNTTPAANAKVVAVGKGLTNATTDGTQVNIVPVATFSGKTTVKVSVTDEGEVKEVDVPVTVLPLPATTPTARPNDKGSSTIAWKPSINAVAYEVSVAGKVVCTTAASSCNTAALIGPKTNIQILAKGNDETVAPVAAAKYIAPKKPVTALVVYFDTNKFNLDAKDKAEIRAVAKVIIEQGFKNIVINGHTDIRGGVDNQVLSNNRANATLAYLKQLVPGLTVKIGAFASTKPAVKGTTAEALASNRRAEVGVF